MVVMLLFGEMCCFKWYILILKNRILIVVMRWLSCENWKEDNNIFF